MRVPVIPNALERLLFRLNLVPAPLLDVAGAAALRTVATAMRLGIFVALFERPRSSADLARDLALDPTSLADLLAFLVSTGYLAERDGTYRASAATRRWLGPEGIGPFVALWSAVVFDYWGEALGDAIRSGRPAPHLHAWLDRTPDGWPTFNAAMAALARRSADEVATKAGLHPQSERLLDLGGSHGLYGAAFCRRHPRLRATVLDLPRCRPRPRTNA